MIKSLNAFKFFRWLLKPDKEIDVKYAGPLFLLDNNWVNKQFFFFCLVVVNFLFKKISGISS